MKILILGFSKSGHASYELLKDNNQVYIYDKKKLKVDNYYSFTKLKKELPFFDLVIRSPGIKQTSKVYQLALILSKKMISEVELGLSYIKNNIIIGVTGSNGKTTLVNILYHLLKDKYTVHKLGNIGTPLTSKIKEIKKGDIVTICMPNTPEAITCFYALNKMFKNATFSIYGDLAQSLYSYRSIDTWDCLNDIYEELKNGHQIYVVAPLIDEAEEDDLHPR